MSELMNIPRLRFPEFEVSGINSHINFLFNDLFVFSTGKNIKQSEASPEFTTPCVRYGELYHLYNEVIFEIINRTNIDVSELKFSEGDEILLPSAGEDPSDIGSASALTLPNIAIGRTINILKPKNKNMYSQIYVSYYINQQLRLKISKLAKGVSISNVYNSDLKKLKIWLPSLPEQKKIANSLTAVDNRIELLEKKKTLLETYKKGVVKKIFNQEIRFKDDSGKDFPDWEKKRLGNVATLKNGYSFKSSSYSKNGIYSILTISNVQEGKLLVNECKKVEKIPSDISEHQILEFEDLLISMTGNVGRVAKVNQNGCLLNQRVGKIVPFSISLNYLFQVLNTNTFRNKMISNSQGGAQPNLSKSDIENYSFNCPSKEEQEKISNFLSSIDNQIELLESQINKSKTWKKGLLQKMFV